MGKLTDLLSQRGMIQDAELDKKREEENQKKVRIFSDVFEVDDLSDKLKIALKANQPAQGFGRRNFFKELPSIGDFFIPASMNGRVLECAEDGFQIQVDETEESVVLAKAYSFNA